MVATNVATGLADKRGDEAGSFLLRGYREPSHLEHSGSDKRSDRQLVPQQD